MRVNIDGKPIEVNIDGKVLAKNIVNEIKREGFVYYSNEFMYMMDNKNIDEAKNIWRFGKNESPCFSETGINGEFKVWTLN